MPQLARHLGRTLLARNAREAPAARALSRAYACALYSRRAYATTTRATKPTATVKKAVKSAAAGKSPPKKAATAKKKTAQKPAAKTTKKAAAKKPAAKKAAPKRRKKKELSDEQKEKLKIRELRAKALREPVSQRTLSAYNAFVSEYAVGKSDGTTQAAKIADASNQFKALTPAQLEHYNHLAKQMTIARKAEFDAWIKSYTPEQIRVANRARFMLRRILGSKQKSAPAYTTKLHDDRHVKAAPNPYVLFFKERHASGDLKNIRSSEASKLIANEWKALSESEKKKYEEEYEATKQRASTA